MIADYTLASFRIKLGKELICQDSQQLLHTSSSSPIIDLCHIRCECWDMGNAPLRRIYIWAIRAIVKGIVVEVRLSPQHPVCAEEHSGVLDHIVRCHLPEAFVELQCVLGCLEATRGSSCFCAVTLAE